MTPSIDAKILTRQALVEQLPALQRAGKKIGFTSGVFDLMHQGHVRYLAEARRHCDLLIVAVNSDSSVRANKGPERPICSEQDRALVVAGLAAVDFVFIFDERNNNLNVELLKPDLYIKAGDYSKAKLSSAALVEAYGGQIVLIPFVDGHSTSSIVDRILTLYSAKEMSAGPAPEIPVRPAVFLDRDGTINENVEYLHDPREFRLLPAALEGMRRLHQAGFRLVVITNQPGIGLGYFKTTDLFRVNKCLLRAAGEAGIGIDKIYFCPHSQALECACRKPKTLLLQRAVAELKIDLSRSFVVGDLKSDIQLGRNAGCRTVLISREAEAWKSSGADFMAADLVAAAEWIVAQPPAATKV